MGRRPRRGWPVERTIVTGAFQSPNEIRRCGAEPRSLARLNHTRVLRGRVSAFRAPLRYVAEVVAVVHACPATATRRCARCSANYHRIGRRDAGRSRPWHWRTTTISALDAAWL